MSDVLGGTLISVPMKVKGDLKNPTVIPLSPSAVGSRLLGIMKRALQVQQKVIEPVLPKKEEELAGPQN